MLIIIIVFKIEFAVFTEMKVLTVEDTGGQNAKCGCSHFEKKCVFHQSKKLGVAFE